MTRTDEQATILNKIQRASEQLRTDAAYLRDRLDKVTANLDGGNHVNSLGELQQTGVEFDRNCALREAFIELAIGALDCDKDDIERASMGRGTYFATAK
jgi:hypothetical protein